MAKSGANLMTVRMMITDALGDPRYNIANFKLVQAILHILAKHLKILNRKVEVDWDTTLTERPASTIALTELKVQGQAFKKKRKLSDAAKRKKKHHKTDSSSSEDEATKARRAKELNVIYQHDEDKEGYTAEVESLKGEIQKENVLVVERKPSVQKVLEFEEPGNSLHSDVRTVSMVTATEFAKLESIVLKIKKCVDAKLPSKYKHQGEAIERQKAAVHMSQRLHSIETELDNIMKTIEYLTISRKRQATASSVRAKAASSPKSPSTTSRITERVDEAEATEQRAEAGTEPRRNGAVGTEAGAAVHVAPKTAEGITRTELENAIDQLRDELTEMGSGMAKQSTMVANNAVSIVSRIETRVNPVLGMTDRMEFIESIITDYTGKINGLDALITKQMTNYQDQLSEMQHNLEIALEISAEKIANPSQDETVFNDLNARMTSMQLELDGMSVAQRELASSQDTLSLELLALVKQLEHVRGSKPDREEVVEAMSTKAGMSQLNELVMKQQFDAVRAHYEKRVRDAYDKFNNQEILWQKLIDSLLRELGEKTERVHLEALYDDIRKHFSKLFGNVQELQGIVGKRRVAPTSRKLDRDEPCLSCETPAHLPVQAADESCQDKDMSKEERPTTIGAEADSVPAENIDHCYVCYPGLPISHAPEARSRICQRLCGGAHTVQKNVKRICADLNVIPLNRPHEPAVGTDGKIYYEIEAEKIVRKPCVPCNARRVSAPLPSETNDYQDEKLEQDFDVLEEAINSSIAVAQSILNTVLY